MPVLLFFSADWTETDISGLKPHSHVKALRWKEEKDMQTIMKTVSAAVWVCRAPGEAATVANPLVLEERTFYPDLPKSHPFHEAAGLESDTLPTALYDIHRMEKLILPGAGEFALAASKVFPPSRWFCFGAPDIPSLQSVIDWCPLLLPPETESHSLVLMNRICERLELTESMRHQIRDAVLGLLRLGKDPSPALEHWTRAEKQNRKHLFHKMMKDFLALAEGRAL